jgi:hypothetical protein
MTRKISAVFATLLIAASSAAAQTSQPKELGIDAGVVIGLGDNSVTQVSIPAQAFRIGFPIGPRSSLEPKVGITITNANDHTTTIYRGELGLLYSLGSDRYPGAYQRAGVYVRPFIGIAGFSDGTSDSNGILGAGIGLKMPLVSRLSSRFEANFAHEFGDNDGNEIGLLAGLSFFTR